MVRMAIRQILNTALGVGKAAVSAAERRLRSRETTSEPSSVGAPDAGAPRAPKSATTSSPKKAAKRKPAAKKSKTSTPRKRATGRRTTASQAAATSGTEVKDAAAGKDD
jgi:hypothetical protein